MAKPDEVGRELRVDELGRYRDKVVVVRPPAPVEIYMTVWVADVTPFFVAFYVGEKDQTIVNYPRGDELLDNRERRVRVYEYLGEV